MGSAILIRDAADADIATVQAIYTHYVLNATASFEEVPPTIEDLLARRRKLLDAGLPYLVATIDDQVAGYAYASSYRPRSAYRYTIEDSVYVADGLHSRGIGTALLSALIEQCEAGDWRQMIAVIGGAENAASIALHRRFGFEQIGTVKAVGFKFGRWLDTILMQRPLGPGAEKLPR